MNAKHLIAIIAVSAAGSAAAESTYPWVDFSGYQGTRTRAEVQAELAASGSGSRTSRQTEFGEPARVASGKTRAEVRAELDRAHVEGNHASGRLPEFVEFGRVVSTRSRDEVRAEAQAARNASARSVNSGG